MKEPTGSLATSDRRDGTWIAGQVGGGRGGADGRGRRLRLGSAFGLWKYWFCQRRCLVGGSVGAGRCQRRWPGAHRRGVLRLLHYRVDPGGQAESGPGRAVGARVHREDGRARCVPVGGAAAAGPADRPAREAEAGRRGDRQADPAVQRPAAAAAERTPARLPASGGRPEAHNAGGWPPGRERRRVVHARPRGRHPRRHGVRRWAVRAAAVEAPAAVVAAAGEARPVDPDSRPGSPGMGCLRRHHVAPARAPLPDHCLPAGQPAADHRPVRRDRGQRAGLTDGASQRRAGGCHTCTVTVPARRVFDSGLGDWSTTSPSTGSGCSVSLTGVT